MEEQGDKRNRNPAEAGLLNEKNVAGERKQVVVVPLVRGVVDVRLAVAVGIVPRVRDVGHPVEFYCVRYHPWHHPLYSVYRCR